MADKLTPDELDAIEKAHIGILGGRDPNGDSEILNARIRCAFDCNQNGAIAHAHRAALLRHVEAMKQEATKREEGWREHVIDLHDKILTLEQEVERLHNELEDRQDRLDYIRVSTQTVARDVRKRGEDRLRELVGRLRAELDACDVEEMAYCGGGDGPCGEPAQQPDTVERARAILADYQEKDDE